MNEVLLEIRLADITTIAADAIVVTADPSLTTGGKLFRAVIARGGDRLKQLCRAIGTLGDSGVQLVQGYGLAARNVLFVELPLSTEESVEAIERAMSSAHDRRLYSIAFPPIGINLVLNNDKKYNAHVHSLCDTIFRIAYQLKNVNSSIRTIVIAVDSKKLELEILNEANLISVLYSTMPPALTAHVTQSVTGFPQHWTPMDKSKLVIFVPEEVTTSSVYKESEEEILQVLQNGWSLQYVYRVQNRTLYEQYIKYTEKLELKHRTGAGTGANNSFIFLSSPKSKTSLERRLWHGTRAESVDHIADQGFDRSFAGANACSYGQGSYFARDLQYSFSDTYSVPGPALPTFFATQQSSSSSWFGGRSDSSSFYEYKYVFRARVLVGQPCLGNSSMRHLSANPDGTHPDTAVDNLAAPKIFVVFKDTQAYPEHLLVFLRRKQSRYMF